MNKKITALMGGVKGGDGMTWVLALELLGAWTLAASLMRAVDALETKRDRRPGGAERRSGKVKALHKNT